MTRPGATGIPGLRAGTVPTSACNGVPGACGGRQPIRADGGRSSFEGDDVLADVDGVVDFDQQGLDGARVG